MCIRDRSSVAQQIGADNMAVPGGELDSGSQTLSVRTDGEYQSVDDVKNALISLPTGGTVRLSQIADVSMRPKDQDALAKVDGKECLLLSVNKQSGSNTVEIAELAKSELDILTADSVSYTHLDVYKRQAGGRARGIGKQRERAVAAEDRGQYGYRLEPVRAV